MILSSEYAICNIVDEMWVKYKQQIESKYPKNATILLILIFCSLCLHRHSKQEKLISAVRDVSILLFTDYKWKNQIYFCTDRPFKHANLLASIPY